MNKPQDRTINYIEFVVSDMDRTKDFYARAFGWTYTDYGPTYCSFTDGHMEGGFTTEGDVTTGGPLVVLYGSNLPEIQAGIEEAGGMITKPVFGFPGGERFHFSDPDGYELAVWTAV